ncbi:hypothetical protein BCR44DRAFT_1429509 [Catenaria anguillulae PL171]|uniref:Uncharacterized protein n=1 Tax=Catenaria anguillulae PL171 TaxID=765915 RepID=A0A1Y2HWI3_9FUNG|nr:hypothetical protein BCR44DRAFT_1429509 [Catenaria anguillulae PL171]
MALAAAWPRMWAGERSMMRWNTLSWTLAWMAAAESLLGFCCCSPALAGVKARRQIAKSLRSPAAQSWQNRKAMTGVTTLGLAARFEALASTGRSWATGSAQGGSKQQECSTRWQLDQNHRFQHRHDRPR